MRVRLLVLLALALPAYPQAGGVPGRQSLTYNIEWRLVTAGKARLELNPLAGRRGYETRLHIESSGLVSKLFKVEDDYTANLNQAFCAESVHSVTNEGVRHREARVTFDADNRRASYLEHDRIKNTVLVQSEIETPPCVHDSIGGLFFLRTLNLDVGQATQIPVSDGKKVAMARVEAQQREEVKTPAGTFRTVRYELFLFNKVLYSRSAHLYIWLTDDSRRIPVQIRVRLQFTIGTITLLLEKQE